MKPFALATAPVLLVLLLTHSLALCATAPNITIVEHGLYSADMSPGSSAANNVRLQKSTDTIPQTPGALFGIRYEYAGLPDKDTKPLFLEIVVNHPPIRDPKAGTTFTSYTVDVSMRPGERRFQGQRIPPDLKNAPAGEYTFSLVHKGQVLASRTFLVNSESAQIKTTPKSVQTSPETPAPEAEQAQTPPPKPAPRFAILSETEHAMCRDLNPFALGATYEDAVILPTHSFALRLPGKTPDSTYNACILALGGQGTGFALTDMRGGLLQVIEPRQPGRRILAVSFTETNGDELPEIVVVAENDGTNPPSMDSRVYFSAENNSAWERRPEVDSQIARLGNAMAVKRWLAQWNGQ